MYIPFGRQWIEKRGFSGGTGFCLGVIAHELWFNCALVFQATYPGFDLDGSHPLSFTLCSCVSPTGYCDIDQQDDLIETLTVASTNWTLRHRSTGCFNRDSYCGIDQLDTAASINRTI